MSQASTARKESDSESSGGGVVRHYLSSLQAFRGLAALAVLVFHLTKLFQTKLGTELLGQGIFRPGYLGADFFFVLSGFIIFYTNRDAIGQPSAARKFITRRLTRLYPVFLSVCFIKLALLAVSGGHEEKLTLGRIAASLLLLPQPHTPLLDVAWTLSFELFFYGLFLVLILRGASLWRLIIAHAGLVVLANLPGIPPWDFPLSFLLSPYFLEFYAGCLACHFVQQRSWTVSAARRVLLVGLGLGAVGWLWYAGMLFGARAYGGLCQCAFWGTVFALITLGTVALGPTLDRRTPTSLKFLGDASYSIYLIHGAVINLAVAWLNRHWMAREHFAGLVWVLVGAGALLAGCAYHLMVEKPLLRLCRRWFPEKN